MNAPKDHDWIEANRTALADELKWLRHVLAKAAGGGPDSVMEKPAATSPLLDLVAEQLQLTSFERTLLLLCVGVEVESDVAHLCAMAHDDPLFAYRTITFYDCPFQKHWTKEKFCRSVADLRICLLRLATPG